MNFDEFLIYTKLNKKFLYYWLYVVDDNKKYTEFKIRKKKSVEYRTITTPCKDLLLIQNYIKNFLENYIIEHSLYKQFDCVTGFVKGKSVINNAFIHKNKNLIVNIDLKDFFPSITFARIYGLFCKAPYNFNKKIASVIAQSTCYNKHLAQGSPLSPLISNLICKSLDKNLLQFAKSNHLTYSRYADDITFSTNKEECPKLYRCNEDGSVSISNDISSLIIKSGFQINIGKFKVLKKSTRQIVTGLVVNKKVNIDRRYIREIRSILHNAEKQLDTACDRYFLTYGYKYININKMNQSEKINLFKKIIRGKIEFIRQIRGNRDIISIKLFKQYFKIFFPKLISLYYPTTALFSDEIACNSTLVISSSISDDDSMNDIYQGSGYLIENNYLVSCYHTYYDICEKHKHDIIAFNCEDYTEKFKLKFIDSCEHYDIAVFKILYTTNKIQSYLKIDEREINVKDKIYAIGYRNGYNEGDKHFISVDIINEIRVFSTVPHIIFSSHITHGMSGGPVMKIYKNHDQMLDSEYKVIGHIVRCEYSKIGDSVDDYEIGVAHAHDIRKRIKEIIEKHENKNYKK